MQVFGMSSCNPHERQGRIQKERIKGEKKAEVYQGE